jgi:hypothetical protein
MTLRGCLIASMLGAAAGSAHADPYAGLAGFGVETDADRFSAVRVRAGEFVDFESVWHNTGVAAQTTRYSQSGWSRNVAGVIGIWHDQVPRTLAGVSVEGGVVDVSGHLRPVGDATWDLRPVPGTGVELLAAAGLVETQQGIEDGIGYSFAGASIDQALGNRVTAIALAGYQPFTDGNDRLHLRARIVFDAFPEQGITLQARWRHYHSSQSDVGGAYFDPQDYGQWLGVAGFRHRNAGWTTSGALGAGREYIRDGGTTVQPSYLAEIRSEGPVSGTTRLAVEASYNRSTGFAASPNYWYARVGITLIVPFR